ncbi:cell division protein PerM [Streptomyces lycii]|uniref:Integral membrane protein n=1 Tax=Streptomyces lycii TaxID=2654337 RepID=A0ABQ7FEJ9_9ACTN|nr:DUF6350 family protein [Streptomyces lycii]KAF4406251.1 hypothetical protein GCU69_25995 [Streptomyces lycii]
MTRANPPGVLPSAPAAPPSSAGRAVRPEPAPAARLSAAAAGAGGGATAAGLGLGGLVVVVLLLWVVSPYPDGDADGALRGAAGLWLLGHGADLVRNAGPAGAGGPVGVSPLLVGALPLWLLHRTARRAAAPERDGAGGPGTTSFGTLAGLWAGYLLVVLGAAVLARGGPLGPAAAPATAVFPAVFAALAVLSGAWAAGGLAGQRLPAGVRGGIARVPGPLRALLPPRRTGTAVRAALTGTAALLGGGALLAGGSLVWHGVATGTAFPGAAEPWPGRIALLLLCLALAPNAAVWGAAYGLGPGFTLGAGSLATPLGAAGYPPLPYFPLLSALPGQGPGTPLTWAAVTVPVLAGVAVGRSTARAAVAARRAGEPVPGWRETALTGLYAAVCCGGCAALLAAVAGGPLGTEALARFGPDPWRTGGAAALWTAALALPVSLALRAWWLRRDRTAAAAA